MQTTLAKLEGIEEELNSHQSTSLEGIFYVVLGCSYFIYAVETTLG